MRDHLWNICNSSFHLLFCCFIRYFPSLFQFDCVLQFMDFIINIYCGCFYWCVILICYQLHDTWTHKRIYCTCGYFKDTGQCQSKYSSPFGIVFNSTSSNLIFLCSWHIKYLWSLICLNITIYTKRNALLRFTMSCEPKFPKAHKTN